MSMTMTRLDRMNATMLLVDVMLLRVLRYSHSTKHQGPSIIEEHDEGVASDVVAVIILGHRSTRTISTPMLRANEGLGFPIRFRKTETATKVQ